MLTALLAGLGLCLSLIAAPGAQNVFLLREGIRRAGESRRHVIVLAIICLACDIVLISAGVGGFGVVVAEVPWLFDAARWAGVVFLAGYGVIAAWRAVRGGAAIDVDAPDPGEDRDGAAPARGTGHRDASTAFGGAIDFADAGARTEPTAEGEWCAGGGAIGDADPHRVHERAVDPYAIGRATTATLVARAERTRGPLLPAILAVLAITWLNPHTYLDTVLLLGSVSTTYGDARWLFAIGAILGSAVWFAILTFTARAAARWMRSPRSWRILDAGVAVVMLALAAALAVA